MYNSSSAAGFAAPCFSIIVPEVFAAEFIGNSIGNIAYSEKSATGEASASLLKINEATETEVLFKKLASGALDSIQVLPSNDGYAVLFFGEALEDPTGKSYYGVNCLYYRQLQTGSKHCKVATAGDQISDVKWNPNCSSFCVISGKPPSQITIFDRDCNPIYDLGKAYRNYISYSPGGRFLMLGGFGNLAGEMDFWDTKNNIWIGGNKAHCTVTAGWSPDSKILYTAVLNPRIRIDNGWCLFTTTGKKKMENIFKGESLEIYEVSWIPDKMLNATENEMIIVQEKEEIKEESKKKVSWGSSISGIDIKMAGSSVAPKIMQKMEIKKGGKKKGK